MPKCDVCVCLCLCVCVCVWIFSPCNFFKWSSLFGCHVSLVGNSQLGPPETSVSLPSPPLLEVYVKLNSLLSYVTCHFFLDKGVKLVGNKNSMEPYAYWMFSCVSRWRHTASATPGYGMQPLCWHQMQKKENQHMKKWPKRANKCTKSVNICTRHES